MFLATIFTWTYAMFLEVFALLGVVLLRLLPLRLYPKVKGGKPILLVHGYINHGSVWLFQKRNLEKMGFGPIYTINLGNPLHSIKVYAEKMREKVEAIRHLTGRSDLTVIGHSMGGVVSCWYATHYPNHITDLITIASPLQGTRLACLAPGQAAKEMRPRSALLKELNALLNAPLPLRLYHIGTQNDQLIIPSESSIIEKNPSCLFKGIGHASLLYSKRVSEKIADWLRR